MPVNVITGMTVCEHWATMTPQSNGKLFTSTLIDFYLLTVFLSLRLEITYICSDALYAICFGYVASLSVSFIFLYVCVFTVYKIEMRERERDTRSEWRLWTIFADFVFECFIKATAIRYVLIVQWKMKW